MTNWHVPSWGLVGRRHDVMCKLIGFQVYDQEQIITDWICEWLKMTNIWYICAHIWKLLEFSQVCLSECQDQVSVLFVDTQRIECPPTHVVPQFSPKVKKLFVYLRCCLELVLAFHFCSFIISNSLKSYSCFTFWFWYNGWVLPCWWLLHFFSLSYHWFFSPGQRE